MEKKEREELDLTNLIQMTDLSNEKEFKHKEIKKSILRKGIAYNLNAGVAMGKSYLITNFDKKLDAEKKYVAMHIVASNLLLNNSEADILKSRSKRRDEDIIKFTSNAEKMFHLENKNVIEGLRGILTIPESIANFEGDISDLIKKEKMERSQYGETKEDKIKGMEEAEIMAYSRLSEIISKIRRLVLDEVRLRCEKQKGEPEEVLKSFLLEYKEFLSFIFPLNYLHLSLNNEDIKRVFVLSTSSKLYFSEMLLKEQFENITMVGVGFSDIFKENISSVECVYAFVDETEKVRKYPDGIMLCFEEMEDIKRIVDEVVNENTKTKDIQTFKKIRALFRSEVEDKIENLIENEKDLEKKERLKKNKNNSIQKKLNKKASEVLYRHWCKVLSNSKNKNKDGLINDLSNELFKLIKSKIECEQEQEIKYKELIEFTQKKSATGVGELFKSIPILYLKYNFTNSLNVCDTIKMGEYKFSSSDNLTYAPLSIESSAIDADLSKKCYLDEYHKMDDNPKMLKIKHPYREDQSIKNHLREVEERLNRIRSVISPLYSIDENLLGKKLLELKRKIRPLSEYENRLRMRKRLSKTVKDPNSILDEVEYMQANKITYTITKKENESLFSEGEMKIEMSVIPKSIELILSSLVSGTCQSKMEKSKMVMFLMSGTRSHNCALFDIDPMVLNILALSEDKKYKEGVKIKYDFEDDMMLFEKQLIRISNYQSKMARKEHLERNGVDYAPKIRKISDLLNSDFIKKLDVIIAGAKRNSREEKIAKTQKAQGVRGLSIFESVSKVFEEKQEIGDDKNVLFMAYALSIKGIFKKDKNLPQENKFLVQKDYKGEYAFTIDKELNGELEKNFGKEMMSNKNSKGKILAYKIKGNSVIVYTLDSASKKDYNKDRQNIFDYLEENKSNTMFLVVSAFETSSYGVNNTIELKEKTEDTDGVVIKKENKDGLVVKTENVDGVIIRTENIDGLIIADDYFNTTVDLLSSNVSLSTLNKEEKKSYHLASIDFASYLSSLILRKKLSGLSFEKDRKFTGSQLRMNEEAELRSIKLFSDYTQLIGRLPRSRKTRKNEPMFFLKESAIKFFNEVNNQESHTITSTGVILKEKMSENNTYYMKEIYKSITNAHDQISKNAANLKADFENAYGNIVKEQNQKIRESGVKTKTFQEKLLSDIYKIVKKSEEISCEKVSGLIENSFSKLEKINDLKKTGDYALLNLSYFQRDINMYLEIIKEHEYSGSVKGSSFTPTLLENFSKIIDKISVRIEYKERMETMLKGFIAEEFFKWFLIKFFEKDKKVFVEDVPASMYELADFVIRVEGSSILFIDVKNINEKSNKNQKINEDISRGKKLSNNIKEIRNKLLNEELSDKIKNKRRLKGYVEDMKINYHIVNIKNIEDQEFTQTNEIMKEKAKEMNGKILTYNAFILKTLNKEISEWRTE